MAIIKLKVSDKVMSKVLLFLNQFKSEDLEIIQDEDFIINQKYAKSQLDRLESGDAKTYSIEEVNDMLEADNHQNEN